MTRCYKVEVVTRLELLHPAHNTQIITNICKNYFVSFRNWCKQQVVYFLHQLEKRQLEICNLIKKGRL